MRPSAAVAALIFLIVAVVQAIRYFNNWPVVVNGTDIPLSVSLGGIIITLIMFVWLLADRSGSSRPRKQTR